MFVSVVKEMDFSLLAHSVSPLEVTMATEEPVEGLTASLVSVSELFM